MWKSIFMFSVIFMSTSIVYAEDLGIAGDNRVSFCKSNMGQAFSELSETTAEFRRNVSGNDHKHSGLTKNFQSRSLNCSGEISAASRICLNVPGLMV